MLQHALLLIISFVGIWLGAGLAISTIENFSKRSRLSYFAVSYLILGFFTSSSEISVGINALVDKDPEIFVGNLVGASIVIFLLVIPLLVITGNKIYINNQLKGPKLIPPLLVISFPSLMIFDGRITRYEAIIAILLYLITTIVIQTGKHNSSKNNLEHQKGYILISLFKIILGIGIVYFSSAFIVDQTIYFSKVIGISAYIISLLLISIGTNIPELSLVIRSVFRNSNQVAFGDFMGSATVNTLIMGGLTLLNGQDVVLANSYTLSIIFLVLACLIFYIFAKSKESLSKSEAIIMLVIYIAFIYLETTLHL